MVLGLIDTVDTVMGHISFNLQASEPQVAITGSSSMAGSLAAWVRAGTGCAAGGERGAGAVSRLLSSAPLLRLLACAQGRTNLSHHHWRCPSPLSSTTLPDAQ